VSLFDREALYSELGSMGLSEWAGDLRKQTQQALVPERHGKLSDWIAAWQRLPNLDDAVLDASGDAVTLSGALSDQDCRRLRLALMEFHPWRKGPFDLFGIRIDTEWRSCLKWNRLAPHVNLQNRRVLDVGCGNGYYGWKMLEAGARLVLGLDPFLLFLIQFEAVRRYAGPHRPHFVLPLTDAALCNPLEAFDVTFSMGVLYHRTSPIDHLQALWQSLVPGGTLVLETLVIESEEPAVLVPEERYAKMRNVWFIPSVPMLKLWLRRAGFRDIRVIDVSRTTCEEQRRTAWMTFESLADFLDPSNPDLTIEGYPGPVRAMLTAVRG
jgi:tRNA (mo5U34)-methyltransferase